MITDYGGFVSEQTSPPSVRLSLILSSPSSRAIILSLSPSLPEKKRGQKRDGVGNVILVRRKIQPESAKGQNQYRTLFSVRHGKSDTDSRQTIAHDDKDYDVKVH